MDFRDALKAMRNELGVTQVELAKALQVNSVTVSRWEIGRAIPNRSTTTALMAYALSHSVSQECCDNLNRSIADASKQRAEMSSDRLASVENASFRQIIDDASFPLYVCDMHTDELIYINRRMEELLGQSLPQLPSRKCYVCLMHRDTPCEFCHKEQLKADRFTSFDAFRPDDRTFYRVQGKQIIWNGRRAHVRYIFDIAGSVNASFQSDREASYHEQLRLRKESMVNAVATAHFNLTHNVVSNVTGENQAVAESLKSKSIDEIIAFLFQFSYSKEDKDKLESIGSRAAMIRQFYTGKTHISAKHYNEWLGGYFECTFDLMQNPITYDIEAFTALWDITDMTVSTEIADRLFNIDYESIIIIDAETGEPRPYIGDHTKDIIGAHIAAGNTVLGVEEYLRKYCVDDDLESVIKGTSLSNIREQLETKPYYDIAYTLKQDDKLIYKRTMFTWLNERRTVILCATQDLSVIHAYENVKRGQIADALRLLQEQAGMNVARYDLGTGTFYSNSKMASDMGYGSEIKNVPEEFIERGLIAPSYVGEYRALYEKLRAGEAATITVPCKVMDGSFHRITINANLVCDRDGKPEQAILSFRDIEQGE